MSSGVGVGGNREGGGEQNLKKASRQYREGLHKIGALGSLCQLWQAIECYCTVTATNGDKNSVIVTSRFFA